MQRAAVNLIPVNQRQLYEEVYSLYELPVPQYSVPQYKRVGTESDAEIYIDLVNKYLAQMEHVLDQWQNALELIQIAQMESKSDEEKQACQQKADLIQSILSRVEIDQAGTEKVLERFRGDLARIQNEKKNRTLQP